MTDVYRIGMELGLTGNLSGGLSAIVAQMASMEGYQKRIQEGFQRWNLAIIGVASVIGGAGVLGALKKVADHGDTLLDQQDKLQRAGISYNDVLRLQKKYYDGIAKSIPTSTVSGYLKTVNELRSVVGPAKAEEKAPMTMMLTSLMGNMAEGQGNAAARVDKLWQAIGMRGTLISDPQGSDKLAAIMARNIMGSGGKITPDAYVGAARRGMVSWVKADPEFIAGPFSSVMQDLTGPTSGQALMSLYQMTSGATVLGKQQAAELLKLRMLDMSKVHPIKGSGNVKVDPGAMHGWELAAHRPDLWTQQWLMPRERALYGNDQDKISSSLAVLGRNRNVIRMLTTFGDPGFVEQQRQDAAVWAQTHSIKQSYIDYIARNPKGVKEAFGMQYESMMQSIGAPMMQAALPVMKAVTEMFTSIGKWANENPEKIKKIGEAFAMLGATLVGAGAVAIIAAMGPAGWLVLGVGALGTALKYFAPDSFDKIAKVLKETWDSLKQSGRLLNDQVFKPLKEDFERLYNSVKNLDWNTVTKGLNQFWDGCKRFADIEWTKIITALNDFISYLKALPGKIWEAIKAAPGELWRSMTGTSSSGGSSENGDWKPFSSPGFEAMRRYRGVGGGIHSFSEQSGVGVRGYGSDSPNVGKGTLENIIQGGGGGFNVRGVKNMNPGNIGYGPWARAHGAIGAAGTDTGHGVAVFPSHEAGAAALEALAASKYAGGKRSIDSLIAGPGGWTPGNHAAAANVSRMMGISPHADARLGDAAMMRKFRDSLMVQELGPAGARHVRERLRGSEKRSSFEPPHKSNASQVIENVMVLDGEVVHRSVNRRIMQKAEHSRQAPYHDGRRQWAGPDIHYSVG